MERSRERERKNCFCFSHRLHSPKQARSDYLLLSPLSFSSPRNVSLSLPIRRCGRAAPVLAGRNENNKAAEREPLARRGLTIAPRFFTRNRPAPFPPTQGPHVEPNGALQHFDTKAHLLTTQHKQNTKQKQTKTARQRCLFLSFSYDQRQHWRKEGAARALVAPSEREQALSPFSLRRRRR